MPEAFSASFAPGLGYRMKFRQLSGVLSLILSFSALHAQTRQGSQAGKQATPVTRQERIEVVATRIPEAPDQVPAGIEVITASELRDWGVTDFKSALALAAGIDIAPGGDGGPASAVPELWGLKEFDAFLLVVDGVPWGGAFNPALAALSLADVERIEILRGPAPVMYGATSFVGVIHVVHKGAAESERTVLLRGGNFSSGGGLFSTRLSFSPSWDSRLTLDVDRQGYRDGRTSYRRGHLLWRNSTAWGKGRFWFSVDGIFLDQDPASPHPRQGTTLSPLVSLDANHNPDGAFLNENRGTGMVGFDRPAGRATWTTSVSLSRARQDILRGFLQEIRYEPQNARGFREKIDLTDFYADSHLLWQFGRVVKIVAGGDYLHGGGKAKGADFEYQAPLDGRAATPVRSPETLDVRLMDRRDFGGLYIFSEWQPNSRVRLDTGLRANLTREERQSEAGDRPASEEHLQNNARLSGSAGVIATAWERGLDKLSLFANYRDTFKPAAIDFGIGGAESAEEGLLKPETSRSFEGGVKARAFQGLLTAEVSSFLMDFKNLVIARTVDGLPALTNAGKERFKGIETAVACFLPFRFTGRATYSFHDARFRDFVQEFDPGVPTQLAGNRLEMSAQHLASVGLVFAPPTGVTFGAQMNYVGSRFLNKRNTAPAAGYKTLALGFGYRFEKWELRVDGRNLTDKRPPVAESELGDAQYYLLPARRIDVGIRLRF